MARKLTKDLSDEAITIQFVNGHEITLKWDELSDDIKFRLMQHGASQKLGDATAGTESVEEAIRGVESVVERLRNNDWKAVREGAGPPRIGLLVEALARITGRDLDECRDAVDGLDDETKKKLRNEPRIKAAMAEIRAEREKSKAAEADGGFDLGAVFG